MEQQEHISDRPDPESYSPPFASDDPSDTYDVPGGFTPPRRRRSGGGSSRRSHNRSDDRSPSRAAAIAGFVCSILGALSAWFPIFSIMGIILALLGLLLSLRGLRNAEETGEGRGLATAGMIVGIVGLVLSILITLMHILVFWWMGKLFSYFFTPIP